MRLKFCLAALAATTVFASPALAQTATASAVADARGLVLERLTLTKVDNLDFGTIISDTLAAGTVIINEDTGFRTFTGGVTLVPTNDGGRGLFSGAGGFNQTVLLTLAPPTFLVSTSNPADMIAVNSMVLDNGALTSLRSTGTTGTFQVGVGGNFAIAAAQPNGFYKADFTVTADYQ